MQDNALVKLLLTVGTRVLASLSLHLLSSAAAGAAAPLDAVVVTAARRSQPLLEAAASISSLDMATLREQGATHAADLLNRVPGVYLQRGSGHESLTAIRSPVLTGAGACSAFLVLDDGLPLRPPGFCNVNELFELNTSQAGAIEVLRGPGGAPHGANAVHGIVNVRSPNAADMEPLRVALGFGPNRWQELKFATAPGARRATGESPRVAAYGQLTHDGGFRADAAVTDAKLNLLLDRSLAQGQLRLRLSGTRLDQQTAGFISGLDAYRDPALRRSNPNPEAFRDAWSGRALASWTRDGCAGCRDEIATMLRASGMQFLQHFLLGKPLERNGQQSLAFSASRERPWGRGGVDADATLRFGIDLDLARIDLEETQQGPTLEGSAAARAIRPAGRHYDYAVDAASLAAHVSGFWNATERLRVGAALRSESTGYRYDNRMLDGNTRDDGVACAFGGCLYSRPADRTDRFDNLSARLEATLRTSPIDRLYAVAANGFRPPETSELYRLQRQQSVAQLSVERIESLEFGWRRRSERLTGQLAAFAMRKRDSVLRDSNGFSLSGGRTRHVGLEYQATVKLSKGWNAGVSGSVARHSYDFSRIIEGGESVVAGNDVDTAPRQLHRLELDWSGPRGLHASAELRHVGRYFLDAENLRGYPGHTVVDLRLVGTPVAGWEVALQARNLLDRSYADRADFAQGSYRYFPAPGREFLLRIEFVSAVR